MSETDAYCMLGKILQKTNDGDELSPEHLRLVEYYANNPLGEKGMVSIRRLYQNVMNGYKKPWYHGIKNMTRDHEGFIYWKGVRVEHYSFETYCEADRAAKELEKICKDIEARGMTPAMSTVCRATQGEV